MPDRFGGRWPRASLGPLDSLGRLRRTHGDRIAIVTLAVESPEKDVRDDVTALPTLVDRHGRTAGVWFGAPPGLHEQVESKRSAVLVD